MNRSGKRTKRAGFSLLEVVVALVVAGVVLTGVLSAYLGCIRQARSTSVSMRELSLLHEVAAHLRTGAAAAYGTQEGELEGYPGFRWRVLWEEVSLPGLRKPVKKAHIEVRHSSGGEERPLALEVLIGPG